MNRALSADLQALQEDLRSKYGNDSQPDQSQRRTSDDPLDDETRVYRKASVGYMEEKYAHGRFVLFVEKQKKKSLPKVCPLGEFLKEKCRKNWMELKKMTRWTFFFVSTIFDPDFSVFFF